MGGAVGQLPNGTTMGQNGQNLRTEDFPALGVGVNGKTVSRRVLLFLLSHLVSPSGGGGSIRLDGRC